MGGFLDRLTGWRPRARQGGRGQGGRDHLALVLRVENMAALTRVLGAAAVAGLLGQIASRVAAELRLNRAMQADQGGHLCVAMPTRRVRRARHQAARLQALCDAGFDLPVHPLPARVGAVLVRGPAHVGTDALFDSGRRHLARHPGMAGDGVPVIDWIAPATTARGPAAAARPAAPPPALPNPGPDPARLAVRFQPQLCCHTGAVTGFQALPRLRHPARCGPNPGGPNPGGPNPGGPDPGDPRPAPDPTDRQAPAGTVLAQALAALRHWDRGGHGVGTVSLGLSRADLLQPRLAETLLWELDRQDIAPPRLVLEMPETLAALEGGAPPANLHRLTEAGCRVDLVGFGTGLAGLASIRRLRVRRVKIDRRFLLGCDHDPGQQRMILAILALADHLGLEALADGVETAGDHAFAAQIGCSHVQGPAIAPPLPLERTNGFLIRCREQASALPRLRRRA